MIDKIFKNPRSPWLLFYIVVNVTAGIIIFNTSMLIGDLSEVQLHSTNILLLSVFIVIFSYFIFLVPIFGFFSRIKVRALKFRIDENLIGQRIGLTILFLQILYLIFNLASGVNIAGSNNARSDSVISLIWILIPVDLLFVIYYGLYREDRYFYSNLSLWLLSNFLRGWSGVFLVVVFMEWCRRFRRNQR